MKLSHPQLKLKSLCGLFYRKVVTSVKEHIEYLLCAIHQFRFMPLRLRLRILRNNLLILFLKCRYRFCLCRKSLILFIRGGLIGLNLFSRERKLIAKHGPNWRLCVFDYEVVEFLELLKHAHAVIYQNVKH